MNLITFTVYIEVYTDMCGNNRSKKLTKVRTRVMTSDVGCGFVSNDYRYDIDFVIHDRIQFTIKIIKVLRAASILI